MAEPSRVTDHTEITDHVAGGLALLTSENRKPVIQALTSAWLARVQEAEAALWGLLVDTTILTATHAQLDQIGALLVLSRGSVDGLLSDTEYRKALRGVALANRSRGTANEALAILTIVLGEGAFTYTESFPAGVLVEPADAMGLLARALAEVLRRARAGGVGVGLVDPPDTAAFAFSSADETVEDDDTHGWSDTDGLTGGALAGVIDV